MKKLVVVASLVSIMAVANPVEACASNNAGYVQSIRAAVIEKNCGLKEAQENFKQSIRGGVFDKKDAVAQKKQDKIDVMNKFHDAKKDANCNKKEEKRDCRDDKKECRDKCPAPTPTPKKESPCGTVGVGGKPDSKPTAATQASITVAEASSQDTPDTLPRVGGGYMHLIFTILLLAGISLYNRYLKYSV